MKTEITRLPEALEAAQALEKYLRTADNRTCARALCKCVFCVNWRRVELVCKGLAEKVR